MKRREFIVQSLSASAVIFGAGYASLDIFGKRLTRYEPTIESRASIAAAKVLNEANPAVDEGLLSVSENIIIRPDGLTHSRPAMAYAQQRAENEMGKLPEFLESQPFEEIVLTDAQKAAAEKAQIAIPDKKATSLQQKISNFETNFTDDIILSELEYQHLVKTLERLNRVQDYVGFGNFNVLSLDDALKYAKYTPRIGEFTQEEKNFLDMMFAYESSRLGFYGEKVVSSQTNVIATSDVVKMPGTGHYVFRGHPEAFYQQVRNEVGDTLILTSGVRNVVKQYQLFMAKAVHASGNLSRASRSLAPPGHSYHAIGDFDVGQVGGGLNNFTAEFAKTDEFKRLQDLGYVRIRYTADNNLGVRYEPWHIRVV